MLCFVAGRHNDADKPPAADDTRSLPRRGVIKAGDSAPVMAGFRFDVEI